jgi:hypothetical protein
MIIKSKKNRVRLDIAERYNQIPLKNFMLIACSDCYGAGKRNHYYKKTNEFKDCETCNGKGQILLGEEFIKYQLAYYNRYIPYLWKILKRELPIPHTYGLESTYHCHKCKGTGSFYKKVSETIEKEFTCKECHGDGIISPTQEKLYNQVFLDFVDAKKGKEINTKLLESKLYEEEEYKEYKKKHLYGYQWVCIKCTHHMDGTDGMGGMDSCCGCVNESACWQEKNPNIYFSPVSEKAKNWYNEGGYKKNIVYDKKHNYRID